MYFQFRKYTGIFQSNLFRTILCLLCTVLLSGKANAQEGLLQQIFKTADTFNQQILEITALSDEDENAIGNELTKEIMKNIIAYKHKKFDVKKVFDSIVRRVNRKGIDYGYKIIKDKEVNAYAVLGGKTFINTGLLDYIDNEDELAFVIAHEISHNELKHCAKKIQYAVRASQINPVLGEVVSVAYNAYSTPFSKYDEFDADELGVKLMIRAGYDKSGAISFFTKLMKLENKYDMDNRGPLNDFISSHPMAEARREKIKEM